MSYVTGRQRRHYQLFVVVGGEVPHVDGAALVPHDEGGLVGVEAHARDGRVDLEQPLTLLRVASGGGGEVVYHGRLFVVVVYHGRLFVVCCCCLSRHGGKPEVPDSGHAVLSSRVEKLSVLVEAQTGHVLCHSFKHVHLQRQQVIKADTGRGALAHWSGLRGVDIVHPYLLIGCKHRVECASEES